MCDNPNARAILANETECHQLNSVLSLIGPKGDLTIEGEGMEDIHALIFYDDCRRAFTILDVNTSEGTTVNEERLDNCFRNLKHGDCIRFGRRDPPLTFLLTPTSPSNQDCRPTVIGLEAAFNRATELCMASLERRSKEICLQQKVLGQQYPCPSSKQLLEQQCQGQTSAEGLPDYNRPGSKSLSLEPPPAALDDKKFRKSLSRTLKHVTGQYTQEELKASLELNDEEKSRLEQRFCNMQEDMECKDESLRVLAEVIERSRMESACLEIQNEALLNSMSRNYVNLDGCRREDFIVRKDMENLALKTQFQMDSETLEKLTTCVAKLNKEVKELKDENISLKTKVKTVRKEIEAIRTSLLNLQKVEAANKTFTDKTMKQINQLKKPVHDMVNQLCSENDGNEQMFSSLDSICKARTEALSSAIAAPPRGGTGLPHPEPPSKGEKGTKAAAEVKVGIEPQVNECISEEVLEDTDNMVRALEKIAAKLKMISRYNRRASKKGGQDLGLCSGR